MSTPLEVYPLPSMRHRAHAFTLIELLVVIGIIAVLVGVLVGVFGGGSNSSTALQSAQGTFSSLLSSARGQAALAGQNAAVAVNFNANNADRYLRYCVVIVRDPTNTQWLAANEGYYLPTGIYVVPPTAPSGNAVETGVSFPTTLCSNGFDGNGSTGSNGVLLASQAFNSTQSESWLVIGISSLGLRVNASTAGAALPSTTNIVLSVANLQPPNSNPPMKFSNAQNVRGFSLSQYGVATLINDATGFN